MLFVTFRARAQGNYQAVPLGGRATLMGGTGVAMGSDGAAPFLNPACIARIQDRSLAFSSKFLRYTHRTLSHFHQPDPSQSPLPGHSLPDTSVSETSLQALPDTTCYFFRVLGPQQPHAAGTQKLAVCLGKTEQNDASLVATTYSASFNGQSVQQSQSFGRSWSSWSVGPSWGAYLTDDLAVGASVFFTRSSLTTSASVATVVDRAADDAVWSTLQQSLSGQSWDVLAHLGVTFRLTEVLTAGLSVRTPSAHLSDHLRASYALVNLDGGSTGQYWTSKGSFDVQHPASFAAGLGAEWPRLRVELDAAVYLARDGYLSAKQPRDQLVWQQGAVQSRSYVEAELAERARPVANVGVGAEYFVEHDVSVLAGLQTDRSALEPRRSGAPPDSVLIGSRLNAVHASAGIGSYSSAGELLIGVRGSYGWGEALALQAFSQAPYLQVIDQREYAVTLILAGRISLRTVTAAALDFRRVVASGSGAADRVKPKPAY